MKTKPTLPSGKYQKLGLRIRSTVKNGFFALVILITCITIEGCYKKVATVKGEQRLKETVEFRALPTWRYDKVRGTGAFYIGIGLTTAVVTGQVTRSSGLGWLAGTGTGVGVWYFHKKYRDKLNLTKSSVELEDLDDWLSKLEYQNSDVKMVRGGYKKTPKDYFISRINRQGQIYLMESKDCREYWMSSKGLTFDDFMKVTPDFLKSREFTIFDERIMLYPVLFEARTFDQVKVKPIPSESFIGGYNGEMLKGAQASIDTGRDWREIQYFSSNDPKAYPLAYYAGETIDGLPNGFGYYNFFPEDFYDNIVYRGNFINGKYRDLNKAEELRKKVFSKENIKEFIKAKDEILESKIIRSEFFPDYIDDSGEGKIVLETFIKWKSNSTGNLDSAVFRYSKSDFYNNGIATNETDKKNSKGGFLLNFINNALEGKLFQSADSIWRVDDYIRIVNYDYNECCSRYISTDVSYRRSAYGRQNVDGSIDYPMEEIEYDNYGYDVFRKYKLEYRLSLGDPWVTMFYFNGYDVDKGELSIDYMEDARLIDRASFRFNKAFLEAAPNNETQAVQLLKLIDQGSIQYSNSFDMCKSIYERVRETILLPKQGSELSESEYQLELKSEFQRSKAQAILLRASASKKFSAQKDEQWKGIWLDRTNRQLFFIESESSYRCLSLDLSLLEDSKPYTDHMKEIDSIIVKNKFHNGEVERISAVALSN